MLKCEINNFYDFEIFYSKLYSVIITTISLQFASWYKYKNANENIKVA